VPLGWFPRLKEASPKQRKNWRLIGKGIGIKKEKKILRSLQTSQNGQGIALEGCGL
jgi:hypothetical protein